MSEELEEQEIRLITNKKTIDALTRLLQAKAFGMGELSPSDMALTKIVRALGAGDSEVVLKIKKEID